MSDLVKRLREAANKSFVYWNLGNEAADAIERKDAAIAELVGALRPFAANRFSAEDWFRASDVVAKYDKANLSTL